MAREPRYLELAAALRKDIARGRHRVGAQLPTEIQLCERHQVSRHTARAALQLLEDEGLIERKPGRGTTVISEGETLAFTQPLGGLDALLQYAHEARLDITGSAATTLTPAQAKRLGARRGSDWLALSGVRVVDGAPIAATTIYIASFLNPRPREFADADKAITEHIEEKRNVRVASIAQSITASALSRADARALQAPEASPVLRTVRRYFDAAERLFVISDTRHPGERFAYEMTYKRQRAAK